MYILYVARYSTTRVNGIICEIKAASFMWHLRCGGEQLFQSISSSCSCREFKSRLSVFREFWVKRLRPLKPFGNT